MKSQVKGMYHHKASLELWKRKKLEGQEHNIQKKRKAILIKE
jgi:hypothetical protein